MSELSNFGEHLDELRRRILRTTVAIGIIVAVVLTVHLEPYMITEDLTIYYPTLQPLDNIAAQITTHMKDALVPSGVQLIQTSPGEAFFAQIYIAALVGLVLGMPIIVRESVSFIGPALKKGEIVASKIITLPAIGLFAAGCLFAYYVTVPYVMDILYRYGESVGLLTLLNVIDFVTFVLHFLLAFGFSFQLPLIMYVASASGAISPSFWKKNVRYAIVIIVIFGAAVTPDGSGITMWFISIPMIALYVAGMLIVSHRIPELNT